MANFERYEPRADGHQVFDGGETEAEDEEEGSRLPLLLVIGLLVVAAFCGVVWLAYTQGVQRGRADAPRMLIASNGSTKTAPANSGGAETPFKGLKIYQQPVPADDEDSDTTPPPTPKTAGPQPVLPQLAVPKLVAPPSGAPQPAVPKPVAPPKAVAVLRPASSMTAAAPEDSGPPQTAAVTPASSSAPPSVATKPPRALTPKAKVQVQAPPVVKPAATAAIEPATPATAPTVAPASHSGAAALQIGAYKSQDEANAAWHTFEHNHAMVAGYSSQVKQVNLGDKGVWYRLRLVGFADKSAAAAFCAKLAADGGSCFLAK